MPSGFSKALFIKKLKEVGLYDAYLAKRRAPAPIVTAKMKKAVQKRKDTIAKKKETNKHRHMVSANAKIKVVNYAGGHGDHEHFFTTDIQIAVEVSGARLTEADVVEALKQDLKGWGNEYSAYKLEHLNSWRSLSIEEVKKRATYHINQEYMFGAHIGFSWINDVKFDHDSKCVYHALAVVKRAPAFFKDQHKLLAFFQEQEDAEAMIQDRLPVTLTFKSGVKPDWIQSLCVKHDITHYAIDYNHNVFLKHTASQAGNRCTPICYIAHDNHMYFITDKSFVNKLSQSRGNSNQMNVAVKMVRQHVHDSKEITGEILEDVPIEKLSELHDCTVMYQTNDLNEVLMNVFKLNNRTIFKNTGFNMRTTKIEYKNNVTLLIDPNFELGLKMNKPTDNLVTWKTVRELCETYQMPFKNQSFPAFVLQRMGKFLKPDRVQITKKNKKVVIARQENKCAACKLPLKNAEFDHLIPLANGGSNNLNNIQALCVPCHAEKTKLEQENAEYFYMPHHVSTFNSEGMAIVKSELFHRFAFVERLDHKQAKRKPKTDTQTQGITYSSETVELTGKYTYCSEPKPKRKQKQNTTAPKLKPFYIDHIKMRRNLLLTLADHGRQIPVFTCMDSPSAFTDSDTIKPGFYYIESRQYFPLRHRGWYSHTMIQYCLDNSLITRSQIKFKFVASLTLAENYFNEAIEDLCGLPYGLDKHGPNIFIGTTNKTSTHTDKTLYTTSFREASTHFMNCYGNSKTNKRSFIERMDEGVFKVTTSESYTSEFITSILYHYILDLEAIELHKLSQFVEAKGGHVNALNTDCIECSFDHITADSPITKPINLDNYYWDQAGTIKKFRYEERSDPSEYERKKQYVHTQSYDRQPTQFNVIRDPEGNNFKALADEIVDSQQSYHVNGQAGSGKTHMMREIAKTCEERELKVQLLAPTNKAARSLGTKASTIHKFIGKALFDQKTLKRCIDKLDVIIVDELSMVRELFYKVFLIMKQLKPSLRFIMGGDFNQLEPVRDRSKQFDYMNSRALYELCDGNRLQLTVCRRSDTKLVDLSQSMDPKLLSTIPQKECDTSICFRNKKRKEINAKWMNAKAPNSARSNRLAVIPANEYDPQSQDMKVFKGLPIMACKTNKAHDIANNETFHVSKVLKHEIVIVDRDAKERSIPLNDFSKFFYPAYCMTVHKAQGVTIDRPYTIYEWDLFGENQKMKYTAVTRSTKFDYLNIIY